MAVSFGLFIEKKQGKPGDDIAAVLKFQSVFLQHRDDIDAVALYAWVHLIREAAGLSVQIGAPGAEGAGLRGEHIGGDPLLQKKVPNLVGEGLVLRSGGQGLVDVGDVRHLGHRADQQAVLIAEATLAAGLYRPHPGRAGPGLSVHGAFCLADMADPVGKLQTARRYIGIDIKGQLGEGLF